MFSVHRWTGLVMSLLFVMWFISGVVMIYHSFPKPKTQAYFQKQKALSLTDSILSPTSIVDRHPSSSLALEMFNDKPVYRLPGKTSKMFDAATLTPIDSIDENGSAQLIQAVYSSSVKKREFLTDYDSWIPWSYYNAHFPIHKYWLDDEFNTQVYVSGTNGQIVQETTRFSRWMARIGAIPHWVYFKQLRLNAPLWIDVVIWLSSIGCCVCLSGVVAGLVRFKRKRKTHALDVSPYKKAALRWHHISGLVFGVFVFTFILSGLMSLADLPSWLFSKEKPVNYYRLWKADELTADEVGTGFYVVLRHRVESSVKRIVCRKQMERCFYEVYTNTLQTPEYYKVQSKQVRPLQPLSESCLRKFLQSRLPDVRYSIRFVDDYSTIVRSKKHVAASTGYEIELDDAFQTRLIVDAQTGKLVKVINEVGQWQWWLYQGLHTFRFGWFAKAEWLRQAWIIILSMGGMVVSVTALALSWRLIKRKMKKVC